MAEGVCLGVVVEKGHHPRVVVVAEGSAYPDYPLRVDVDVHTVRHLGKNVRPAFVFAANLKGFYVVLMPVHSIYLVNSYCY